MFQFPGFPPSGLCVHPRVTVVLTAGFPHSDIAGSLPAHDSPTLFAVCHVLLRPLSPRHPPFAFSRLSRHTETARQLAIVLWTIATQFASRTARHPFTDTGIYPDFIASRNLTLGVSLRHLPWVLLLMRFDAYSILNVPPAHNLCCVPARASLSGFVSVGVQNRRFCQVKSRSGLHTVAQWA